MLDRAELGRALARAPRVVRVVVASTRGSAPREAGTAMLVGPDFEIGTIGGGTLEHQAIARARALTGDAIVRQALGPDLGQCCGGAVVLLFEAWDAARLAGLEGMPLLARPLPGESGQMPLSVRRLLAAARAEGRIPAAGIVDGWMLEPLASEDQDLWVWGAGHVGRAIVTLMAALPGYRITWVDTGADRFPATVPEGVQVVPVTDPLRLAGHAPGTAHHLILTYSHSLDLGLCDALLTRGFGWCGLIGSASKWARFRKRLNAMGHPHARIAGITCPIGNTGFGKHPQEIAVGVAAGLLEFRARKDARGDMTG